MVDLITESNTLIPLALFASLSFIGCGDAGKLCLSDQRARRIDPIGETEVFLAYGRAARTPCACANHSEP